MIFLCRSCGEAIPKYVHAFSSPLCAEPKPGTTDPNGKSEVDIEGNETANAQNFRCLLTSSFDPPEHRTRLEFFQSATTPQDQIAIAKPASKP